ncbi:hypothetical protein [Prevotella sp. HUN102]|uniref:hypothetical protein n=1 Tax=Prevotella sp. HUN102 TaxID=1392486 RepID=UPI00068C7A43|nr:hypothetical protein [Prevotella sp. HUN102]
MKKNIMLSAVNNREMPLIENIGQYAQEFKKWIMTPLEWLRRYYSAVLEKDISNRQAVLITQAQLAFILAVFPVVSSILLHIVFMVWFAWSVYRCKEEEGGSLRGDERTSGEGS